MKFISSKQIDLEGSLRISSSDSPRQILRFGLDQYVVIDMENAKLITAFESPKFSTLINSLKQEILEVEVIATRPILTRETVDEESETNNSTTFEIRMFISKQNGITFNSNEESHTFLGAPPKSIVEENSRPASEHWPLPARLPYKGILVTPEFIKWMSPLTSTFEPAQILERCLSDYRKQSHPIRVNPGKHIHIQGEFGNFTAIEYLCGRICLHHSS